MALARLLTPRDWVVGDLVGNAGLAWLSATPVTVEAVRGR